MLGHAVGALSSNTPTNYVNLNAKPLLTFGHCGAGDRSLLPCNLTIARSVFCVT